MSPPRNPGAANFNRLVGLGHRLEKVLRNIEIHERNSKHVMNAYRAMRVAYGRAGTPTRQDIFRRQMQRTKRNVNAITNRRRKLTNQRRNIRHQIGQILGQGNVTGFMNEMHQNNVLAGIRLLQETRLARAIERAYLEPGGRYTQKMIKNLNT
jgi:hypothetical protein